MNPPTPLPRAVVRVAAQWMACLHAGEATASQRDAFALWRGADPLHELAWQRAERLHAALGTLPPALGLQVLDRPRHQGQRRVALRTMAALAAAVPAGYLAWRGTRSDGPGWTAAHSTATGERRSTVLPDGTRLHLNTATAVDLDFQPGDAGLRRVLLHRGEVQIETAHDAQQRPFVVDTRHGRIRALGTRFVVRQLGSEAGTLVAVQHSAVEVRPGAARGQPPTVVQAGRQARFDTAAVQPLAAADPQQAAWTRGLLFAANQRLADFAAELGRHRPGLLRCAPAVAGLRISGVFRLDDTDAVLAALPDTLPVRVAWRTRWWVAISAPSVQSAA
ncbi:FecR domain-containing protein [Pseudorhodoferax sp.]|uniref:FecR domain-containing protein n=1 Tax=Pseudorhodoferax sp. TaxID=1993553 RepID=UPI002DD64EB0|nr:FecR domain-containing protein [Pseudorhodoferax sp.]